MWAIHHIKLIQFINSFWRVFDNGISLGYDRWKNVIVVICWLCILIITYYRWLYPCEVHLENDEWRTCQGSWDYKFWVMKNESS
jgi:hypothetical protein